MLHFFRDLEDVFAYLDDILIASHDFASHARSIRIVLNRAINSNITHNLDKNQLAQKEVKFLGGILSLNLIVSDLGVANRLFQGPRPRTPNEFKTIIPAMNWYHSFVPGLASLTHALTKDRYGATIRKIVF